jgi:glycosyltransferase involved in cell wall biosynthesis
MVNHGFDPKKIHIIYNSLDYENQLKLFLDYEKGKIKKNWNFFNNNFPTIIFIGRLTPAKKVDILIKAIEYLNIKEHNYNLLIVGKGDEDAQLKKLAINLINKNQCFFVGEEYNEEQASNYIYFSDLCVSPGNIGLSTINALSYGTPVGTHGNKKNQMPEAEVIKNQVNGFHFEEDNFESLAIEISRWFDNKRNINKKKLREIIDLYYNSNFQIEVFKKILKA